MRKIAGTKNNHTQSLKLLAQDWYTIVSACSSWTEHITAWPKGRQGRTVPTQWWQMLQRPLGPSMHTARAASLSLSWQPATQNNSQRTEEIDFYYFLFPELTNSRLRLNIYDPISLMPETNKKKHISVSWLLWDVSQPRCSLASLAGPRGEREAEKLGHSFLRRGWQPALPSLYAPCLSLPLHPAKRLDS